MAQRQQEDEPQSLEAHAAISKESQALLLTGEIGSIYGCSMIFSSKIDLMHSRINNRVLGWQMRLPP